MAYTAGFSGYRATNPEGVLTIDNPLASLDTAAFSVNIGVRVIVLARDVPLAHRALQPLRSMPVALAKRVPLQLRFLKRQPRLPCAARDKHRAAILRAQPDQLLDLTDRDSRIRHRRRFLRGW